MPSVIKPGDLSKSKDVVLIPDIPCPACEREESGEAQQAILEEREAILRQAKEEGEQAAQALLAKARSAGEEILETAKREAVQMKAQAEQAGYEAGVQTRQGEIEEAVAEFRQLLTELERAQREYLQTYAEELKFLAADMVSKVVCKRISEDELELTSLVEHALGTVKSAQWITVQISDRLPELGKYLSELLPKRERGAVSIQVEQRDLPEDTCIIQTSEGTLDATVSRQLENLRELMKTALS